MLKNHADNFVNKLETFNSIVGWCNQEQFFTLEYILSFLDNIKGDIIELGVFTGKSAGIFNNYVGEGETLKLVDMNMQYDTINQNIKKLSDKTPLVEWHNEMTWCINSFPQGQAKFIHIDAGHSYDNCWNDLNMSLPLLNDNGIIAVDDFFMDIYPQVTEATYNFVGDPNHDVKLFLYSGHKAYICKSRNYENVVRYVIDNFKEYVDLTKQPYYLNKSSTFLDSRTMSIVPIGDNKNIHYYRGLDEDNSIFPNDFINII